MANIASAIRDTISISLFNRGLAGKIFEEVKQSGAKVVMKNNAAECVLLAPDEYIRIMDHYDPNTAISGEDLYKELGISKEDLDNFGEVDIE